jgi:hypothetical protein
LIFDLSILGRGDVDELEEVPPPIIPEPVLEPILVPLISIIIDLTNFHVFTPKPRLNREMVMSGVWGINRRMNLGRLV